MTVPANATPHEMLNDAIAQAVLILWSIAEEENRSDIKDIADKLNAARLKANKEKNK